MLTTAHHAPSFLLLLLCLLCLLPATGCREQPATVSSIMAEAPPFPSPSPKSAAPHGGALTALGGQAHLELMLDASVGRVYLYVLAYDTQQPLRVQHKELRLRITQPALTLALTGVRKTSAGDTLEHTSTYTGHSFALQGLERCDGVLEQLTVNGQTFHAVAVSVLAGPPQ